MMVCSALLGHLGCIMPPPIEQGEESRNHAPRLVPDSPPPFQLPALLSEQCPEYIFRAIAEDPDPGDTLYWRVFIDYANDNNQLDVSDVKELPPDPSDPGFARTITFAVRPLDPRFDNDPFENKFDRGHVVELLVADRPFESAAIYPFGRSLTDDEGKTHTLIWAVELTPAELDNCSSSGGL